MKGNKDTQILRLCIAVMIYAARWLKFLFVCVMIDHCGLLSFVYLTHIRVVTLLCLISSCCFLFYFEYSDADI